MLFGFGRCIGCLVLICLAFHPRESFASEPVRVPGTRVSLAAPDDFYASSDFPGFRHPETGATIVIYEIPQPIRVYKENFSSEAIEEKGVRFIESSKLRVDSFDGLMVRAIDSTRELEYEVLMVVFGEIRKSVLLLATYPERDAFDFRSRVTETLLSAEWDPESDVPSQEGLSFEIEETSRLKISGRYPDTLVLTEGGRARASMEAPILLVRSSAGQFDFGNLEAFSKAQLKENEVIGELNDIKGMLKSVDGMPGYEIKASGVEPKSGTRMAVYQLVLGEEGQVFIIQGFVGDAKSQTFIEEFGEIAETLRRVR